MLSTGLYGAYSRKELNRSLGILGLRAVVKEGGLVPFSRTVLVEPRQATEFLTRAAASLLVAGPKAVLSGHSALAMHGCSAADLAPIHVTLPYQHQLRNRPGLKVHYGRFAECDVGEPGGLRALAPDVALAEVLCRGGPRAGLACADQLLAMTPVAERDEFRAWTEHRIRTRIDARGAKRALALLNLATGLAESPPESWLVLILVDAGLPVPEPQVTITDLAGVEIYRLDLAWREPRVAVEYDGYDAHHGRRERDAARDEDLRRRGWIVCRAEAHDLKDPSRLIAAVRAAFRARGFADR